MRRVHADTAGSGLHPNLLRPLALTSVVFFTVSGGPYGLEPLLANVGFIPAICLLLAIPLVWCLPTILMVLELNGMMPRNGGYYQWVRLALGPRWGFFEGWWSWLYTFADLAIYPVLFTQYLIFFVPETESLRIPVCLAIVWICALLNLLGIVPVGRWSTILAACVLAPFCVLFAATLFHHQPGLVADVGGGSPTTGAMGLAIFTVMWNYLGWDNTSTVAEEVERPVRSYFISVVAALLLIVGMYLLSMLAAGLSGIDPTTLAEQGFPSLGLNAGGWWLGMLLAAGGMASSLGLFLSTLLSVSRVPKAMADDGLLPVHLGDISLTRQVPHVSIIVCSVIVSGMILWGFSDLIIIDVTLYGTALVLELCSLVALRFRSPETPRPFRIPLGSAGVIALSLLPTGCWIGALVILLTQTGIHAGAVLFALGALMTGPLFWSIRRRLAVS